MSKRKQVDEFIKEVRGVEFNPPARFLLGATAVDRIGFMQEELDEFQAAATLEDQVDALVDLQYFLLGTLYEMGVTEEQYDECFNRVHQANMQKIAGVKRGRRVYGVDAEKPDEWQPPEFGDIL